MYFLNAVKACCSQLKLNWKHFDTEEGNLHLPHFIKHCIKMSCIHPGGSEQKDHWRTKQWRCGLGRDTIADESTPASTLVIHPIRHTYAHILQSRDFSHLKHYALDCKWEKRQPPACLCHVFVSVFLISHNYNPQSDVKEFGVENLSDCVEPTKGTKYLFMPPYSMIFQMILLHAVFRLLFVCCVEQLCDKKKQHCWFHRWW